MLLVLVDVKLVLLVLVDVELVMVVLGEVELVLLVLVEVELVLLVLVGVELVLVEVELVFVVLLDVVVVVLLTTAIPRGPDSWTALEPLTPVPTTVVQLGRSGGAQLDPFIEEIGNYIVAVLVHDSSNWIIKLRTSRSLTSAGDRRAF